MIDPKSKYTVLLDDNGSFTDLTDDAADLTRDNFALELVAAEDKIYVGLYKPFNSMYTELPTPNTNAGSMSAEIWNGTAWVSTSLTDETKGYTRSGFMYFDTTDMTETTVNGVDMFWVRLTPSVDQTAMQVRGINLIFADDSAMKAEFWEVDNASILPPGETSHVGTNVATRNAILHHLRNHYSKQQSTPNQVTVLAKINQFDLFDIFEVREAAVYLSLSKIFFNLSDNPDDHWWLKSKEYQDKYEQKITVARLSIDQDNDGIKDPEETQAQFQPTRWFR